MQRDSEEANEKKKRKKKKTKKPQKVQPTRRVYILCRIESYRPPRRVNHSPLHDPPLANQSLDLNHYAKWPLPWIDGRRVLVLIYERLVDLGKMKLKLDIEHTILSVDIWRSSSSLRLKISEEDGGAMVVFLLDSDLFTLTSHIGGTSEHRSTHLYDSTVVRYSERV